MMRLAVLAAALAGFALLAATASATPGHQTVTPYRFPPSCGGLGDGSPVVVSAAESGGLPVELKFGWAALQTQQLDKFLAVEDGSVTLTDPNGNIVFSEQWDPNNTSGWSPYAQTQITSNGKTFYQGWGTQRFEEFGALSNPVPGSDATYRLSMTWELTKAVNDGFGSTPPGPIITLTNCPLIVHNYSS